MPGHLAPALLVRGLHCPYNAGAFVLDDPKLRVAAHPWQSTRSPAGGYPSFGEMRRRVGETLHGCRCLRAITGDARQQWISEGNGMARQSRTLIRRDFLKGAS